MMWPQMTTRIENLWALLSSGAVGAQQRVDAVHPLELYADFLQPDRPGLVLFCAVRPPEAPSLRAISIEQRQRPDGRWVLRLFLEEPRLLPVFAELCMDIVEFTRSGVSPEGAGATMLARIDRWHTLMQGRFGGMSRSVLRGLIGELLVLETLLAEIGPEAAVRAWRGPLGADQDFQLPNGLKVEVKAIASDAAQLQINGLGQLDGGADPLQLATVRLEVTGHESVDAITASGVVARLRARLAYRPAALQGFESMLGFAGWDDRDDTSAVVVRLVRIDRYDVHSSFPRLIAATVPSGIVDASYTITLPPSSDPK